jgi:hypothetical protein
MTNIPGYGKEAQVGQFQILDFPGHQMDQGDILLSLKMGLGKHEDHQYPGDSAQGQAEGRFSHGKPTRTGLYFGKMVNQGF